MVKGINAKPDCLSSNLALTFHNCVMLGKFMDDAMPQLPHVYHQDNNSIYFGAC